MALSLGFAWLRQSVEVKMGLWCMDDCIIYRTITSSIAGSRHFLVSRYATTLYSSSEAAKSQSFSFKSSQVPGPRRPRSLRFQHLHLSTVSSYCASTLVPTLSTKIFLLTFYSTNNPGRSRQVYLIISRSPSQVRPISNSMLCLPPHFGVQTRHYVCASGPHI